MSELFLPGVHRAPNIQTDPNLYEIENLATDPDGKIEQAMREIGSWDGRVVVDMGAGTGFYVSLFHDQASHVYAIEPHAPSRLLAMDRCVRSGLDKVSVMTGSAERTLLKEQTVGFYHSRFAYFWPPNCAAGIYELDRIMKPGGTSVIIDSDYENGQFGRWLSRRSKPEPLSQAEKEAFWASYGFQCRKVISEWRFDTAADLESVIKLEFGKELGARLLENHQGLSVEYIFCLYHRQY